MKKIIFGITSLNIGGAERVLVDICNKLCEKYDITIFTIYAKGEFEKSLNKKIKLINLYNFKYENLTKMQQNIIPLKFALMKKRIYNTYIKNKFDIEIAFLEGPITTLFSQKNNSVKKIAWVHNDIGMVFGHNIKSMIKKILNNNIYKQYKKIVFVSNHNKEKYLKIYKKQKNEKLVIHNYVDKDEIIRKSNENIDLEFDNNSINFVTVSRLVKQKAIGRLIDVHYKLIEKGYKHKIYVIGDGELKEEIKDKIKKFNLEKTFILLGKKDNPYPYMKNADYFCLFSYYEGLPMVLLEAKVLEKYIVCTDTASREALEDYNNKKIVENSEKRYI